MIKKSLIILCALGGYHFYQNPSDNLITNTFQNVGDFFQDIIDTKDEANKRNEDYKKTLDEL